MVMTLVRVNTLAFGLIGTGRLGRGQYIYSKLLLFFSEIYMQYLGARFRKINFGNMCPQFGTGVMVFKETVQIWGRYYI
jgi:hypothetical protein